MDLDSSISRESVLEEKDNSDVLISSSREPVPEYPRKRFYRQRAHCNPLSYHNFEVPESPEKMDWTKLFGSSVGGQPPEFVDVGCGYGGLLVKLAPMFPNTTMVGMEIRQKVSDFVQERIKALRAQNPGQYDNICCLRSNAMQNMLNFYRPAQLSKMFFLFPDPHFKKRKHKWRIISTELLEKYSLVLRPEGRLYTITDVEELHNWMVDHLERCPLFRRLTDKECEQDPVVPLLYESTEEGQKVTRNCGQKWSAVFQRLNNAADDHSQKQKDDDGNVSQKQLIDDPN